MGRGLRGEIAAAGASAATLELLAMEKGSGPAYVRALVGLAEADDAVVQSGAVWLLRWCVKDGKRLSPSASKTLLGVLKRTERWAVRLQILQMLGSLEIGVAEERGLWRFLVGATSDSNAFVRAWAYNGLGVVASRYPKYGDEARRRLAAAMHDKPAVRARVRRMMEELE